jgi:hypothetical protein
LGSSTAAPSQRDQGRQWLVVAISPLTVAGAAPAFHRTSLSHRGDDASTPKAVAPVGGKRHRRCDERADFTDRGSRGSQVRRAGSSGRSYRSRWPKRRRSSCQQCAFAIMPAQSTTKAPTPRAATTRSTLMERSPSPRVRRNPLPRRNVAAAGAVAYRRRRACEAAATCARRGLRANLHTSLTSTMPAATQARHAAITRAQNKRSSWFSLRSRRGFMQFERRFVHLIPGRRRAHSFHTPAPFWPAPGGGATGSRWLSACRNAVRISSARTGLKSSRPIRSALAACE